MANVIHPQIDFHIGPANHTPSPFGFGFGLSSAMTTTGWSPAATSGHTHSSPFQQFASNFNQPSASRLQKRRHEPEDDAESVRKPQRDESMDRSPTPERPKRAAPKRARVAPPEANSKGEKTSKESKDQSSDSNDVDVGVLLGEF
jgi:hypothetical protein